MTLFGSIQHAESRVVKILDAFLHSPNWIYKTTACLIILIYVTAFPPFTELDLNLWDTMTYRAEHLFSPLPSEVRNSHTEKFAFRIAVPLIGRLLHFNALAFYLMSQLSGLLLIFFVQAAAYKLTADKITSFLVGLAVSCIFIGKWGFYDVYFHFDAFAILMLILAMHFRSRILIFLFIFVAAYTDERALIASALVFLWWKILEARSYSFRELLIPGRNSSVVIASWIAYGCSRVILQHIYGLATSTSDVGIEVMAFNYKFAPLALLLSLEGLWILVAFGVFLLFEKKLPAYGILFILLMALSYLVALMVFDVSRSTGYLLPSVTIGLFLLQNEESGTTVRRVVMVSALICLITPTMEFLNNVYWLGPIVPKIFKLF